jgi:LCP family protein required for cell wall assembly
MIAGFLAIVLLTVTGVAWATLGTTPENASGATDAAGDVGVVTGGGTTTDANGNTVPVAQVPATNILIVGSDARTDSEGNPLTPDELKAVSTSLDGGGVNTDTIMILHIPEGGAKATAISIPRDTWMDSSVVGAAGVVGPYSDGTTGPYKPNKINSFYGTAKAYSEDYLASKGVTGAERERQSNEAGRTMLIKVVQQFTGLKINHYAEINLIGFYLLSNAIGGVPVCLNAAVKDRQSGADFPAGQQTVQGKAALSFVRQRHGLPGGDLDRIRRQQAFLAGAANKILSVGTLSNPSKLSSLVTAANRSLVLDKNFDLLSFGQQMVGLTSGRITFVTIPIAGSDSSSGTDALGTDPVKIRAFFAGLSAASSAPAGSSPVKSAPSTVNRAAWTVDVQNATMVSGMAAAVGQKAANAGFQRGQLSDYPDVSQDNQKATTTIHYGADAESAAAALQKVIGHGTLVADTSIAATHLLVIAGQDLPKPTGLRAAGAALRPETDSGSTSGSGSGSTGSGSGSGADAAAVTTSAAPGAGVDGTGGDAINAAHPGCVN